MSRTMARFSSSVVCSASVTCHTDDFATSVTTDARESSSARTCGSSCTRTPALRVAPNATRTAFFSASSPSAARAKNSVSLGIAPGQPPFDEPDAELVEQARDGELVGDRVGDALALRPVAQRRVEDVERVGLHGESSVG